MNYKGMNYKEILFHLLAWVIGTFIGTFIGIWIGIWIGWMVTNSFSRITIPSSTMKEFQQCVQSRDSYCVIEYDLNDKTWEVLGQD